MDTVTIPRAALSLIAQILQVHAMRLEIKPDRESCAKVAAELRQLAEEARRMAK